MVGHLGDGRRTRGPARGTRRASRCGRACSWIATRRPTPSAGWQWRRPCLRGYQAQISAPKIAALGGQTGHPGHRPLRGREHFTHFIGLQARQHSLPQEGQADRQEGQIQCNFSSHMLLESCPLFYCKVHRHECHASVACCFFALPTFLESGALPVPIPLQNILISLASKRLLSLPAAR